jgi:hypothetical protein
MTFAMCSSWRPSIRRLLAGGLAGLVVFGIVAARVSPEGATGAAAGLLRVLRSLGSLELSSSRVCRLSLRRAAYCRHRCRAWLPTRSMGWCLAFLLAGGCRPCVFSQQIPVPSSGLRLAHRRSNLALGTGLVGTIMRPAVPVFRSERAPPSTRKEVSRRTNTKA